MPQAGMPIVRDNLLRLPNRQPIPVGSDAWFRWLAQATHFCYQPPSKVDRLTLRKEKRRHQCYWYAYLKRDHKLHNTYAGRTEMLTTERLQQIFTHIMTKVAAQSREVQIDGS